MTTDTQTLTLTEINAELGTLPAQIADAQAELRGIEQANDQTAKGLDVHGRATSKLAMLTTRKATLEAAQPAAELASMKEKIREAEQRLQRANEEVQRAEIEVKEILDPLLNHPGCYSYSDAVSEAKPVSDARQVAMKAYSEYERLLRPAIEFAREHHLPANL